jgi:hypothetical protein
VRIDAAPSNTEGGNQVLAREPDGVSEPATETRAWRLLTRVAERVIEPERDLVNSVPDDGLNAMTAVIHAMPPDTDVNVAAMFPAVDCT